MADLKITLRNNTNPEKPSEIFIGNTRLTGLFANRLGMNATINVRNPDVDNRKNLEREVSSREYSEPDYISGTILMEAVKEYLKGKNIASEQSEVILEDNELNRKIFSDLYTQLNNILPELEKNRAELGGIFTQVEGENPGHKKLATDLMQKAMETATINLLKGEKVNWKIDLKNEAAKHAVELTWSNEIVNKVDGWLTRVVSWFKRTFENLFMKKGLGEDTYLKCSLVDDHVLNEMGREAGELLKEYYIRSVNEPLGLTEFLNNKGETVSLELKQQVIDLNTQVTTDITNPSNAIYKTADSKISARYGEYQNIAKQISEQNFYKDIATKLEKEVKSSLNIVDQNNLNNEATNNKAKHRRTPAFHSFTEGDFLNETGTFNNGHVRHKSEPNLKSEHYMNDSQQEVDFGHSDEGKLTQKNVNLLDLTGFEVPVGEKLTNLLKFISSNVLESDVFAFKGGVKVGNDSMEVCIPQCVLQAYNYKSDPQVAVDGLRRDLEEGENSYKIITDKINAARQKSIGKSCEQYLTEDFKAALSDETKFNNVLDRGEINSQQEKLLDFDQSFQSFNIFNDNTNKLNKSIQLLDDNFSFDKK